ncbi:MAG TPA: carbohydrate kinase family protein [Conexibacter sp.]|nr:carbohydrate kinase family protein [Conexibacter sp.]
MSERETIQSEVPAICLIGNLNLDLIIRGVRELPSWGHEIAGSGHTTVTSGQGGYVSLALAKIGVPVDVIANVGDDAEGRGILADLERAGIGTAGVEVAPGTVTGITVGIVRPDGERAFVSHFASLADFDAALVERQWETARQAPVVCLVGLFSIPGLDPGAAARIFARARSEGRRTVLDTGWDPDGFKPQTVAGVRTALRHVEIFLPNLDEATALTGETDPLKAARALQSDGPRVVVVKCGADGSVAVDGEQTASIAATPVEVVDAVGAGDAFDGAFLFAHLSGWELQPALALSSAAAGIHVSRAGDRHASLPEAVAAAAQLGVALPPLPPRPAARGGGPRS